MQMNGPWNSENYAVMSFFSSSALRAVFPFSWFCVYIVLRWLCAFDDCSVLSLWLSSTLHTLPYCFWYSQPPDCSHRTLLCWFPRLFCFQSLYIDYDLPLPLRQKPSLYSFKLNPEIFLQFPETLDLPCFPSRATVFIRLKYLFAARFKLACK